MHRAQVTCRARTAAGSTKYNEGVQPVMSSRIRHAIKPRNFGLHQTSL